MDNIAVGIQRVILEDKLATWKNTRFSAEVELRLAKRLNDDAMKKAAEAGLLRCETAIATVEEMLAELPAEGA